MASRSPPPRRPASGSRSKEEGVYKTVRGHEDARQHHRHSRPRGFHGRSGAFPARARRRDRRVRARCRRAAAIRNRLASGEQISAFRASRSSTRWTASARTSTTSIDDMRKKLGANAWPILIPIGEEDYLKGQIDVVNQKAVIYLDDDTMGSTYEVRRDSRGEQGRRSTRPTTIWSSRFPIIDDEIGEAVPRREADHAARC